MFKRYIVTILLLAICTLVGSSCTAQATQDPRLAQIKTPFWTSNDLEINKISYEKYFVYDEETNQKPPFYKDSMPLKYSVGFPPGGLPGYSYGSEKPLFYEFDDFTVYFIYEGAIVIGAQAYDEKKQLLAEVTNIYFYAREDMKQGIDIEELHYDTTGKLIYKCRSVIDPFEKYKTEEKEQIGKKTRDYFFIWPGL
jgi:hypothetical protein